LAGCNEGFRKSGAVIYPTETIAFMILEKSGTEQFKRLSPLLNNLTRCPKAAVKPIY
jgi:hypothetical protein